MSYVANKMLKDVRTANKRGFSIKKLQFHNTRVYNLQ